MANYESDLQKTFIQIIYGLKTAMRNTMKEKDVTLSPLYFMMLKGMHEIENCTAHNLTEFTQRDKGQVTRLIKELIAQDFVRKKANPSDKRSQFLYLTEKGLACYLELQAADNEALTFMRSQISDKELQKFLSVGQKMVANLKTYNSESEKPS